MAEQIAGVDIYSVKSSPEHNPTTIVDDPRGKFGIVTFTRVIAGVATTITVRYAPGGLYRYHQASNVIVGSDVAAGGDAVMIDPAQTDALKPSRVTPTTAATSKVAGVAHVSIPDEFWGFVQIRGRVYNAKVIDTGVVEDEALIATATAGALGEIGTATGPSAADYAAGRRPIALVDVGANLWDIELLG